MHENILGQATHVEVIKIYPLFVFTNIMFHFDY